MKNKSIFDKNNNIMNCYSYELKANSRCYYHLHWIITLELEYIWCCKKYHCKRNKTKDNFHSFVYLLS